MQVGLEHYLVVSALLFCIGLVGVVIRGSLIMMLLSLELMLNAANLSLVAFSRHHGDPSGQILVFFVITVAASEVAVGLALVVALFRRRRSVRADDIATLKL